MRSRPLTVSDLATAPTWLRERGLRPDLWRDESTRSVIAVDDDGLLVAGGMMWTSAVHGGHAWADVVVDPARRREGIGAAVVRHLLDLRSRDMPLTTRGLVGDPALAFADALGARTIQLVPPAVVSVARRVALRAGPAVSAAELPIDAVERVNAVIYRWTHASWSPVTGSDDAINQGLRADADATASSVVLDEAGHIAALVLVFHDDPPSITAETVDPGHPRGERILEAAVRRSLDTLAERGVDTVTFDGHVTDPHLLPVLARLQPTGRWLRLIEIP